MEKIKAQKQKNATDAPPTWPRGAAPPPGGGGAGRYTVTYISDSEMHQ